MAMELKRIGVLSVAKVQAVMMALLGLLVGMFYAVIMGAMFSSLTGSAALGAGYGLAAIIFLPVMYGVMGFIGGAIVASLYNLVAGWVGGVEMSLGNIPNLGLE